MSITTLIVIVLAVIVLVVVALGFGAGWSNLWSKISGMFSSVNVDTIKQNCQVACAQQASYAYCCQQRDLRLVKGEPTIPVTCINAAVKPTDCDLTCTAEVCGTAACKAANLKPITPPGSNAEKTCNPNYDTDKTSKIDKTATLDSNLQPFDTTKFVCCK